MLTEEERDKILLLTARVVHLTSSLALGDRFSETNQALLMPNLPEDVREAVLGTLSIIKNGIESLDDLGRYINGVYDRLGSLKEES